MTDGTKILIADAVIVGIVALFWYGLAHEPSGAPSNWRPASDHNDPCSERVMQQIGTAYCEAWLNDR
jgi:hypothetical protein